MRQLNHSIIAIAALAGCTFTWTPDPPLLQVTSPQRSLVEDQGGPLEVTGTVAANPDGQAVAQVTVNGVVAKIAGDGTFTATLQIAPGATVIHTVATDVAGGTATDTRSVEAGTHVAPGTEITSAITTSISAQVFSQIGSAATTLIKTADLTALVQPLNPIASSGSGCDVSQAFIDSVALGDASVSLTPTTGGLQIFAELDGIDVAGHMNYETLCLAGSNTFEVTVASVSMSGTISLTPATGSATGLAANFASPDVQLTGLNITASGLPGAVLALLPISSIIQAFAPAIADLALGPILNDALGTLTAPMQLSLLGQTIDIQVTPSVVSFDPSGGNIALDMSFLIEGTENSPGFITTPSTTPVLSPGNGLALGLADDLANEALAELTATGLLNLTVPPQGGANATLKATSPPMITANGSNGELQLVLPDMLMTISQGSDVTGEAWLNVQADVEITPTPGDATSVQIDLGTPAVAIDPIAAPTGAEAPDLDGLGTVAHTGTTSQLGSITQLLQSIPLPKIAGLQLTNTSVTGDGGYIILQTSLQ
jgi:hypothetical protein